MLLRSSLIAALALAGCSGSQAVHVTPQLGQSANDLQVPGGLPGIAEIAKLPAPPIQVASDLAGNEWIAGVEPAMLVRINEQTHALTQFTLPNQDSEPFAIALGPGQGSMWFTELASNTVGTIRLSDGSIHRYSIPTAKANPLGITAGPDNAMWFTETSKAKIGRIDVSSHKITEYALPSGREPDQIILGPDGALWFTDVGGYGIGRLTTSLQYSEYGFKSPLHLIGITTAPDGGIWYVGSSAVYGELVGRIDPSTYTRAVRFYDEGGSRIPQFVTSRDGELWFTEQADATIARYTIATHKLQRYGLPKGYTTPLGIALGTDNQLWFTEQDQSPQDPAVGKLCPSEPASQCANGS